MNTWLLPSFAAMNIGVERAFQDAAFSSLGYIHIFQKWKCQITGLFFNFLRNCQPTNIDEGFQFLDVLASTLFAGDLGGFLFYFFIVAILRDMR